MKREHGKKKISMVRRKPTCYGRAAPVERGVLAYLIPGDRRSKAILLSPVVSKVWSPHSTAWTEALHLQILCTWWSHSRKKSYLSVLRRVAGLSPQDRSSNKGGQSGLHAQVLPLVLTNAIKIFAFGLSSELKLSVTKTSFTFCTSNTHCDTQQFTLLQK